ncbi:hypothetical protein EVAR_96520_1 [Eumeta japonica]|uniref:Uncharacterized protein n=1 Tax=Eumeta variegata TaxID=151549 RepID=A0A4C1WDS7_EUMVA|nr:hypothetical protein EVAR_96520_1 [Eumeta japonica]
MWRFRPGIAFFFFSKSPHTGNSTKRDQLYGCLSRYDFSSSGADFETSPLAWRGLGTANIRSRHCDYKPAPAA